MITRDDVIRIVARMLEGHIVENGDRHRVGNDSGFKTSPIWCTLEHFMEHEPPSHASGNYEKCASDVGVEVVLGPQQTAEGFGQPDIHK